MDGYIMDRVPPELSDAVKSAVADPRFAEIFKMVAASTGENIGNMSATNASENASANIPPNAPTQSAASSLGGIDVGGLMAMLPKITGMLGGSHEGGKQAGGLLAMSEDKKRLLCALKPFVSEKRASAIDSILKIYEITGITSALGIGAAQGGGK